MGNQPLKVGFWLMLLSLSAYAQTSFDPLTVGIGARALGMGKAYVAIAEDGDAVFNNPAGLGEIDSLKLTSMGGNLLEDVTYTILGGVYPLGQQSAVGFGYAGAFVSGIELRDAAGNFSRKANYGSSVFLTSFGKKLGERTSLGISLKYYFTDGTEIDTGDRQNWNVDLGILQKDLGPLDLGLVGQNILSSDQPLTIRAGASVYLLGSSYKAAILSPLEMTAALDAEINPQNPKATTLHSGIEFSPASFFTLRAGLDQNDLTAGLSLKFAGMGFHYAYHPQAQYLSITYDERGWPIEPVAKPTANMIY